MSEYTVDVSGKTEKEKLALLMTISDSILMYIIEIFTVNGILLIM